MFGNTFKVFIIVCVLLNCIVSGELLYRGDNSLHPAAIGTGKRSSIFVYRRSCIRRGGACDFRPSECCFSSSCRCNLWGSNCRCQRMGLFQKWG